jgi:AbrB family looped-hinge helix DNA binding protein
VKQTLTIVTRKGQITLPIEIRRELGIKEGDKVAVFLVDAVDGEQPKVVLKPVRSVAELTFGAVPPRKHPLDLDKMRRMFEEETAKQVMAEMEHNSPLEREESR